MLVDKAVVGVEPVGKAGEGLRKRGGGMRLDEDVRAVDVRHRFKGDVADSR